MSIIHEGWLLKKGTVNTTYQRRYFRLNADTLVW